MLIDYVRDAWGREADFTYDTQQHLTAISDVGQLSSSFAYSGDSIVSMTTPYRDHLVQLRPGRALRFRVGED